MAKHVQAVYENGILRPLEPLALREHELVGLIIEALQEEEHDQEWLDAEYLRSSSEVADESVSLESVRQALSKMPGTLTPDFIAERDEE